MDKTAIIIIIAVIFAGLAFWAWQSNIFIRVPPTPLPEGMVLFFGDGCPHCENVEVFLTENKINEKLKITRLEIPFLGKTSPQLVANQGLIVQLAEKCAVSQDKIGLPFLYDGNDCLQGDEPIINFFKNEADIK